MTDTIPVEVAFALPDEQAIIPIEVPEGITIEEAIRRSGIQRRFPSIDLSRNKVGIFGKLARLDTAVQPGDRVEIYRPLIADPKEARRKRAARGRPMKKGAAAEK